MVATIAYVLKNDEGQEIERSSDEKPLIYLHGAGNIIEGLEDGLEEHQIGDDFNISVNPKLAYGEPQARLISTIPKERFPGDAKLIPGETFVIESEQGPRTIRIIEVDGNDITIDANHPFAGKTLHFSGTVLGIREGTIHELNQGHPQVPPQAR
jgi:FKBP-type peptidyl-prolyl cis-trans isomerase SlyD